MCNYSEFLQCQLGCISLCLFLVSASHCRLVLNTSNLYLLQKRVLILYHNNFSSSNSANFSFCCKIVVKKQNKYEYILLITEINSNEAISFLDQVTFNRRSTTLWTLVTIKLTRIYIYCVIYTARNYCVSRNTKTVPNSFIIIIIDSQVIENNW